MCNHAWLGKLVQSNSAVQVVAGQTAALALKKVKRNQVRKGMVLVDERAKPKASWEFDADIAILTHSTTIQPRYQVRAGLCTCACTCVDAQARDMLAKSTCHASLACNIMLVEYSVVLNQLCRFMSL